MAIINCKECGTQISTKAESCPKCGAKQVKTSGCAKFVLIIFGIGFVFALIGNSGRDRSTPEGQAQNTATSRSSTATPTPNPLEAGTQWQYSHQEDPMAKGVTYNAIVQSTNVVEFEFPYSDPQHASLALRNHPRHGKDVLFSIERGQILCRSYDECTILVRFDDNKAQSFSAVGASDNSTETIFIRNYDRFVQGMLKAKKIRISVEIYQQGSPVFEFDVSDFNISKYKPK